MKRRNSMKRATGLLLIFAMAFVFVVGSRAMQKTAAEEATIQTAGTEGYAAEVVRLVNIERAKIGEEPLSGGNSKLNAAAQKRAEELAAKFSHTRPDESSCFTVLPEFGVTYSYSGENIAGGHMNPDEVMYDDGWMDSAGHKANILNSNYNKIGVGVYNHNGMLLWVQLFVYSNMADDVDPTNPTTPTTPTNPANPTNPTPTPKPISKLVKVWEFFAAYIVPIFLGFLRFMRRLFLGIW